MNTDLFVVVMPIVVALIAAIAVLWKRKKHVVVDLAHQSTGEMSVTFWMEKFDSLETSLTEVKMKQDIMMTLLQEKKGG